MDAARQKIFIDHEKEFSAFEKKRLIILRFWQVHSILMMLSVIGFFASPYMQWPTYIEQVFTYIILSFGFTFAIENISYRYAYNLNMSLVDRLCAYDGNPRFEIFNLLDKATKTCYFANGGVILTSLLFMLLHFLFVILHPRFYGNTHLSYAIQIPLLTTLIFTGIQYMSFWIKNAKYEVLLSLMKSEVDKIKK